MLNLGAYRPLPQNHYCYHEVFLQLFLHLLYACGIGIGIIQYCVLVVRSGYTGNVVI